MQVVTHKLFGGRKDPCNMRFESCFHVLTRFNICNSSQIEFSSSAEYMLLFLAASTKERKTSHNPGARRGLILCVSVRHAAREAVLEWRSVYFYGTLCRGPNTDYALSRRNLRNNFVRNPDNYD
jgi:hypothetical protein